MRHLCQYTDGLGAAFSGGTCGLSSDLGDAAAAVAEDRKAVVGTYSQPATWTSAWAGYAWPRAGWS